ncbi:MAG: NADH-ubiquinone oxidoreductase-F iron-sulfur binding region domain-containing protein [Actinomycetes bacterium]
MSHVTHDGATGRHLRALAPPRAAEDETLLDGPVRFPAAHPGMLPRAQPLGAHLGVLGPRPRGGEPLLDDLDRLALTGRGGGHFPAARKWRTVRDAVRRAGRAAVVVANAAEGEPASAKDLALLVHRPHLVLDGLVCAAESVGAEDLVLWTHGDNHPLHRVLAQALHERRAMLDEPVIRLVSAPGGYVSGESSAILRALAGGPALPQFSLEHAAAGGGTGPPTLVHNVETLARVGLLARCGPEATPRTSLVTVLTAGRRTVVEAGEAWRLADALVAGGWPVDQAPQAVLMGGYGGQWLPWAEARDLRLHGPTLRAAGASLGAGVLVPLPAGACGLAETARVARFLADSGARQCGPCLFGLPALAGAVEALASGQARGRDLRRLQRWAGEVSGRGGCHHPDGTVRLILSALRVFGDDCADHRRGRPCAGSGAPSLLPVPTTVSA